VTELAAIETRRDGNRCFVRIRGEVDMSNVLDLTRAIEAALPNDAPFVVVDLTETTYLDSAGVQLLFRVAGRLRSRRHRVAIVAPPEGPVRAVLDLVGLGALVTLFDRREDVPAMLDDDWPAAP